uniref:Uncharacterized protein n=1 Tax=Anguilla anguilla TaxID=7936 RepID=A0A0E9W6H3_ANGAN
MEYLNLSMKIFDALFLDSFFSLTFFLSSFFFSCPLSFSSSFSLLQYIPTSKKK